MEDENEDEEKLWAKTISSNPAFDFLAEDSEEEYNINDGECFTLRPQK